MASRKELADEFPGNVVGDVGYDMVRTFNSVGAERADIAQNKLQFPGNELGSERFPQFLGQGVIRFYRHHLPYLGQKCSGQHARAWTYLKYGVALPYPAHHHDTLGDTRMHKEILAQRFFCVHARCV